MYCGQCGKKVMENMLFCPFCGSPIVIPDQDEVRVQEKAEAAKPVEIAEVQPSVEPVCEERPVSLFEAADAQVQQNAPEPEQKSFVPLSFDFETQLAEHDAAAKDDWPEIQAADLDLDELLDPPREIVQEAPRPARKPAREMRRPEGAQRRSGSTYIPVKDLDVNDMFMDGGDDDDYDVDEDVPVRRSRYQDDFEFEEPEYGGFFQRHIRGLVGLMLLLLLLVICTVWAFAPKGQEVLAQVNLAWKAQPYADLGYEAYQMNSDLLAARYYEKAFSRDNKNYEYAHSAMVAYYEAEEIESAAAMLKKCIELAPNNPEPYQEMLILYPDASNRPWEITELIRLGYQRTGHGALKLD